MNRHDVESVSRAVSSHGRSVVLKWPLRWLPAAMTTAWLCVASCAFAEVVTLPVASVDDLREAIAQANQNRDDRYVLEFTVERIQLDELGMSGAALPTLLGELNILGVGTLLGGGQGSDFRLIEVGPGGSLDLGAVDIEEFHSSGNGGVLTIAKGGQANLDPPFGVVAIRNCSSAADGGAIYVAPGGSLQIGSNSVIRHCQARRGGAIAADQAQVMIGRVEFSNLSAEEGGAIWARGPISVERSDFSDISVDRFGGSIELVGPGGSLIAGNRFGDSTAGLFACAINVNTEPGSGRSQILRNQFRTGDCPGSIIDNAGGDILLGFNGMYAPSGVRLVNSTGDAQFQGNVLDDTADRQRPKILCFDFGSGAFSSLGANIASDGSCFLDHPSDLPDTTLDYSDVDGLLIPAADSVTLDRGPAGVLIDDGPDGGSTRLPCGYRDLRGLGRPQDGNGDGVFECDSGAIELQGAADIGPPQSGIYFDPARSGEGHFVELFGAGQALVSTFSYGLNGGMAWFIGVGSVVGNSVVVDEMLGTRGGVYGPDFDEDAIERFRVGGLSLVFNDCPTGPGSAHMAFAADPDESFEDLSTQAVRLAAIVPCSGDPSPIAWRSGAWFAPGRSGEGIFVQYLPDGRAVVVFYGYTPDGQQFWAFSGDGVTVDGDVLTAPMLYPATTTRFGRGFDPAEVDLQPFGLIRITQIDCDHLLIEILPTLAGYAAGSHEYVRLTRIEGTSCPQG